MLLLKGTDVFTKSVLDYFNSIYLSQAFQLISNHLLEHFTKDQLEQFVETIVSKNNTTTMNKTRTFNPRYVDFDLSSFLDEGWTYEDLVFKDEGDGMTTIHAERIVPICYWENFIKSALTPDYDVIGFVSREDVHCIFNCLKYVGDASAKKLFLHEDDNGFIMIKSSQTIVKLMLNHLTKESQEEVKQQWRNNAPPMSSFFTKPCIVDSISFARSCSDILRFYLNYGSENHLNEFIDVVTSPHNIGEVKFSVWSCAFEKLGKDETKEMLTLVVEKIDIIGRDDVKKLLLHEIDQVPFIIKSLSRGEDVDGWLDILPKEIKREIQQFIQHKANKFLDKASSDFKTFFMTLSWQQHYNKLNTFTFFLNYQNDKSQLEKLMQNIMSPVKCEERTRSIWAELLTKECEDHKTDDIEKMDKFMKIVSEKLDSNSVKKLVMHKDGEKPVIFYPVLRGEEKLLETMLNYLSTKDRKKIQRQVDEYLDKTFKIPPDGNWINRFPFSFF